MLNVHAKKRARAHGFLASVFSILDQNGLSVDLISSSEVHVSMAIHSENGLLASSWGEGELRIRSQALQRAIDDLKAWGEVDLVPNQAIISLVGRQLPGMKGVSGRFFSTLGENGINIGTFNLGRREAGGEAVLLLSVDGEVPAKVRDAACQLPGVKRVMALNF